MLIQRGELLFGADGFLLRNAADDVLRSPLPRSADKPLFELEFFAQRIGMPVSESKSLLQSMVDSGWLSCDGDDFAAEQQFIQLGAARIGTRRLTRKKAAELLARIVDEASRLNRETDSDCDFVTEIAVFGSYIDTEKAELGDLDVAVSTHHRKPFQQRDWHGWDDFWKRNPEKAARVRLRGGSPYVSLHKMKELLDLGVRYQIVYRLSEDLPAIYPTLFDETKR